MTPDQRTLDQIALTREEYQLACERLEREPNEVALWTSNWLNGQGAAFLLRHARPSNGRFG